MCLCRNVCAGVLVVDRVKSEEAKGHLQGCPVTSTEHFVLFYFLFVLFLFFKKTLVPLEKKKMLK